MGTLGVGLALVLTLVVHTGLVHGLRCLECQNIQHPEECDKVGDCADGDVCFVEQYITLGGLVQMNIGCRPDRRCHTKRSIDVFDVRKTRDNNVVTCMECCHDDFCNVQGCGQTGKKLGTERGPLCFQCGYQDGPGQCRDTVGCDFHQKCLVAKHLTEDLWYSMCATNAQCVSLHKVAPNKCVSCCDTDFCNDHCGNDTTLSTTPGPSTTVRQPTETTRVSMSTKHGPVSTTEATPSSNQPQTSTGLGPSSTTNAPSPTSSVASSTTPVPASSTSVPASTTAIPAPTTPMTTSATSAPISTTPVPMSTTPVHPQTTLTSNVSTSTEAPTSASNVSVTTGLPITVTPDPIGSQCNETKLNVFFVLESSPNQTVGDILQDRMFINSIIQGLDIHLHPPGEHRVEVMTLRPGGVAELHLRLNESHHTDKADLMSSILNLGHTNGTVMPVQNATHEIRGHNRKVIFITPGLSTHLLDTTTQFFHHLYQHDDSIDVMAIGTNNTLPRSELDAVTHDSLNVSRPSDLGVLRPLVMNWLCDASHPTSVPTSNPAVASPLMTTQKSGHHTKTEHLHHGHTTVTPTTSFPTYSTTVAAPLMTTHRSGHHDGTGHHHDKKY